jgi:hypothetical protein
MQYPKCRGSELLDNQDLSRCAYKSPQNPPKRNKQKSPLILSLMDLVLGSHGFGHVLKRNVVGWTCFGAEED